VAHLKELLQERTDSALLPARMALFFGKVEMEDGNTLADYDPRPTAWTRAPSCTSRSPRRRLSPACLPPPPPPPRAGPACALLGLADPGGGVAGRRDGLADPRGGGGAVGSKPEKRDPWCPRRVHWWRRRFERVFLFGDDCALKPVRED